MRNQKGISAATFKGIRWIRDKDTFHGEKYIFRKPYGPFNVTFDIYTKNGETMVGIRSIDHPPLNWSRMCNDYDEAVQKAMERFERMGELVKKLEERNDAIKKYCTDLMNQAIQEIQKTNEILEEQTE